MAAYYDAEGASVAWELSFSGLSGEERAALDGLFDECEGRLRSFLFLDPAANLLRWSEDFSNPAWTSGPMLSITEGQGDPWGGLRAFRMRNTGAATQTLSQTLNIPGAMQYCLSVYVRGAGTSFGLRIDSGGFAGEKSFRSNETWMRYVIPARPGGLADSTAFSLVLPPGSEVEVTAVQAEAQPGAGGYRLTTSSSGVYPEARFDQDSILWQRNAPEDHSATIHIVSRPS